MVTFNIIEGEPSFWEKEQEFISLYNNDVRRKDIIEKLNLTHYSYDKLVNKCKKDGSIIKRREISKRCYKGNRKPKYVYYDKNTRHYNVIYRGIFYAHFLNINQAKKFVKIMKQQHNWDYKMRKSVKDYILKKGVN